MIRIRVISQSRPKLSSRRSGRGVLSRAASLSRGGFPGGRSVSGRTRGGPGARPRAGGFVHADNGAMAGSRHARPLRQRSTGRAAGRGGRHSSGALLPDPDLRPHDGLLLAAQIREFGARQGPPAPVRRRPQARLDQRGELRARPPGADGARRRARRPARPSFMLSSSSACPHGRGRGPAGWVSPLPGSGSPSRRSCSTPKSAQIPSPGSRQGAVRRRRNAACWRSLRTPDCAHTPPWRAERGAGGSEAGTERRRTACPHAGGGADTERVVHPA